MYRPWMVRAVALLLTLVGLQAGAFQDLDTKQKRYFGVEKYGAAVRAEARKADPALQAEPFAAAPSAPPVAQATRCSQYAAWHGAGCSPVPCRSFDATGPPRA